jgi:hypothetical protein
MVGPEEFESSSIAPEATSLDQTSRRPQIESLYPLLLKLGKSNQKAIVTRVKSLSRLVNSLQDYSTVKKEQSTV